MWSLTTCRSFTSRPAYRKTRFLHPPDNKLVKTTFQNIKLTTAKMSASTARRSGDASPAKKAKGGGGGCVTKRYVSTDLKFARLAPSCSLLWPSRRCLSHPHSPTVSFPNPFHRLQSELMQLMVRWRPRDAARAVSNTAERRAHRRGAAVRTSACVHPSACRGVRPRS